MKVLLGVTGSVAATLTPKLVEELLSRGFEVQVVVTDASLYFFKPDDVSAKIWRNEDEWLNARYAKGDKVLHIELSDWADVLLIAPLDANTLGKIANGLCDNLLTCVARSWDVNKKPVVLAPAMNTRMWDHPVTEEHLNKIGDWLISRERYGLAHPVSKMLACGTEGMGAMADVKTITNVVDDFKKVVERLKGG